VKIWCAVLTRFALAGVVVGATASLGACGGGGSTTSSGGGNSAAASTPTTASIPEAVVTIADNSFTPGTITIQPGTKVIWKWSGSNPHVVLINGERSPEMTGTGTFEKVFRGNGTTINYQCAIHGAAMSGKIVIQ
jgi:plastocyanin